MAMEPKEHALTSVPPAPAPPAVTLFEVAKAAEKHCVLDMAQSPKSLSGISKTSTSTRLYRLVKDGSGGIHIIVD